MTKLSANRRELVHGHTGPKGTVCVAAMRVVHDIIQNGPIGRRP